MSTQDRRWTVELRSDEEGFPDFARFEDELARAMHRAAGTLHDIGGALQVYMLREQDPTTQLWHGVQAVFKWQSFVPGVRAPRPAPEPEPDVELEPEGPDEEMEGPGEVEELADLQAAINAERESEMAPEALAEETDAQVFKKGAQRAVAETAAEAQELLRTGWQPVPRD